MVSFAPTPQDSPRAPTVTMVRCLRAIDDLRGRMVPRASPRGYEIVSGRKDPFTLLAWFPRWCGDRLIADGLIDSDGRMTPLGLAQIRKDR